MVAEMDKDNGWMTVTIDHLFLEKLKSIEQSLAEANLRSQQRFEAQEVTRNADGAHFDRKLEDLKALKTHDLIGVEHRFQLSKELVNAGFETQSKSLDTALNSLRDIRAADNLYFETKIVDLRELKAHELQAIEQRFQLSKEAVADALQAAKEAVTKAEDATERRFSSVNEFRATLSDQAAQLMPRAEAQTRCETLQANVARIELDMRGSISNSGGKSNAYTQFIATGLAVAAIVVALGVGFNGSRSSSGSTTGVDDRRIDDLVNRIDGLSRRIETATPPGSSR